MKEKEKDRENMSVRINLNSLSDQQKALIRELLFLQPKKTNFMAGKFSFMDTSQEPVLFYWVDKPNNEIVLPYTFANSLLGYHVNSRLQYPVSKFNFKGTLRDYQIPLVQTALQQLREKGTTTLLLGTGAGKSAVSCYLSSVLGGLTLILTNRSPIQEGWIKTFQELSDAGIWVIQPKIKIPQQCNVIISMDGRIDKIPWEIRKMVSVLVIDEAHMFSTPSQVSVLLGTAPKYVIACTATLTRPDGMEKMIQLIAGTHSVEYKIDKHFKVYRLFTGIKTEIVNSKMGTPDWSKLVRDLSMDPTRNAFIVDLIEKNVDKKIVVLTWSKDHVDLLYNVLKSRNQSVDYLCGNKSKYVDSRVLLGTISKISTGFDAKNASIDFDGKDIDMLIAAGSTKSHNLHIQSIGRAFRSENPVIIDLVDDNRISKSHWSARKKNYEEMNCEILYVEMHKKEVIRSSSENSELSQADVEQMQIARINALRQKVA